MRIALVERDDLSVADLVTSLESLGFVECAAPNYLYQPLTLTSDPLSIFQWGLSDTSTPVAGSTLGIDYSAASAAVAGSTAKNVVAVLDVGVDYNNPDLANVMWTNAQGLAAGSTSSRGWNGFAGTDDPMPALNVGHGTHCAGVIAAQADNGVGVVGIAGEGATKIMALRAGDDSGSSLPDTAIISCYEYLVSARLAGVNVVAVNNSWGAASSTYDSVLDYAVNQAGKAGVLSCFAVGNEGVDAAINQKTAMTESPYAIVVAASNSMGNLASFGNYNATGVDVAAPGAKILSTINASMTGGFQPAPLPVARQGHTRSGHALLHEHRGAPGHLGHHWLQGLPRGRRRQRVAGECIGCAHLHIRAGCDCGGGCVAPECRLRCPCLFELGIHEPDGMGSRFLERDKPVLRDIGPQGG